MSKENSIKRNFWLLVLAAFVLLIAAWTTLIWIAAKNQPETVPLERPPAAGEAPREAG